MVIVNLYKYYSVIVFVRVWCWRWNYCRSQMPLLLAIVHTVKLLIQAPGFY